MRTRVPTNVALTAVVAVLGLACIFPFFWMLRSSFMGNIDIYQYPPVLLPKIWKFENYPSALTIFPFGRYFLNTLTITLPSVFGVLLTSTMAAYALARLDFPFKKGMFALVIGSMLMPGTVTIIPIFKMWTTLHLGSGYIPLIVPAFLGGGAFNIFLCRQFLMTIPRDLDEAARIDGASPPQIFWRIYLPLMAPALVAVGTYALLLAWNEYLYAFLLLSSDPTLTVPVVLGKFLNSDESPWNYLMAASIVFALPPLVIYYVFRRYMSAGLTMGGIKG